jgi:hypothetical protein
MNSSQQQFLNKGKRPQLKIQTQKWIRYLLHYLGKNFNSPPPRTKMEFGVFQSSKKRTILTNVCLFNGSHGFLRFFTRFSTQKVYFHSETTRTPFGLPKRNLQECRANFSKIHLLCFVKAVKIINLAPLKIPETLRDSFSNEHFKRISQKV